MHVKVHPNFSASPYLLENPVDSKTVSIVPLENDATDGRYNPDNQLEYISSMHNACHIVMNMIFIKKESFQETLKKTGNLRREIAEQLGSKFADKFGKLREPGCFNDRISTPLIATNEYKYLLDLLLQIDEKDQTMEWECYSKMEEKSLRIGFRLGVCHDQKVMQLSKYVCSTLGIGQNGNVIAHTYPENLKQALAECQFLFDSLVGLNSTQKNSIQKYMAEFHWWFIQAAPYFRGTSACAEILMSAFNIHFFQQPLVWKEGIHPDRIALTSSLEEFVTAYPFLHA